MSVILWLVAFIILIVAEVVTLQLISIWFATGALVAIVIGLLGGSVMVQFFGFIVVSFLLLILVKPITKKFMPKMVKTNVDSLIGKKAQVKEDVNSYEGTVYINGLEWSARTHGNTIPKGEFVTIETIDGVKLIVEKVKEERVC